jgi:hypothetical protein
MRDEKVAGPEEAGWPERIIFPQVKKQRPLRPADFDVHAGISETVVDQVAGK